MNPTRVTYGEWEPIYGPERVRQVATRWTLLTVAEYTEVRDRPITGYRRKRFEFEETPRQRVPRMIGEGPDFEIVAIDIPATTVARWEWEYRGRELIA